MCNLKEKKKAISDYIVSIQMSNSQYTEIKDYCEVSESYQVYDLLSSELCLGGTGGFTDQGGEGRSYQNDIHDPEIIEMFYPIMDSILPDIPFELLETLQGLKKSEQRTDSSDYYGNTYDFQLNYIVIDDLLNVLEQENLIDLAYSNI